MRTNLKFAGTVVQYCISRRLCMYPVHLYTQSIVGRKRINADDLFFWDMQTKANDSKHQVYLSSKTKNGIKF